MYNDYSFFNESGHPLNVQKRMGYFAHTGSRIYLL